jgi:hypothetical protein
VGKTAEKSLEVVDIVGEHGGFLSSEKVGRGFCSPFAFSMLLLKM